MFNLTLPFRLSILMTSTIVLFLVTVSGAVLWMSIAMDGRAEDDSRQLVNSGLTGSTEKLDALTADYNKWDAAYVALRDQDADWLYENYVAGIETGNAMNLITIFGGFSPAIQSWTDDGITEPSVDIVPRVVLDTMQRRVSEIPLGSFETVSFAAMIDGVPFILSGTRVEPYTYGNFPEVTEDSLPFAIFGVRVSDGFLTHLSDQYLLKEIKFSVEQPDVGPWTALPGSDGAPVGYINWTAPTPGTTLMFQMMAPLTMLAALFVLIAGAVTILAWRSASQLVIQEANSAESARTDFMTNLPNRLAFIEYLEKCPMHDLGSVGILFLDLNGFKRVNDTIGHEGGDVLVRQLAERLDLLRESGVFLARIGGDEFAFVATGAQVAKRLVSLSSDVSKATSDEFVLKGHSFLVSAAQGMAVNDDTKLTADELVRRADLAMYSAKRSKNPEAVSYTGKIETLNREDKILEDALRLALEKEDEFEIHYQPIVDAKTGALVKVEALARWNSAVIGAVPPDRFIEIAETCGLIIDLGRVLLHTICWDLTRDKDLQVSINISPLQLQMPNFVRDLVEIFKTYEVSHQRVELELTESVAVDNAELAAFKLNQLNDLGFKTSLDDFGTGFSSIGYLRQLPFDTLKIDRSFVEGIEDGNSNCQMVGSIISLGHSLDKIIVCEGVETLAQAETLKSIDCDLLQGYYFGRPMTFADLAMAFPNDVCVTNERSRDVA